MATKKKQNTSKQLKAKTWKTFSEYTRLRYADTLGYVRCVTCGTKRRWNDKMQAGHFIQGRHNATLFEETNVHPQCIGCNIFKNGSLVEYYQFMLKTYGEKEIKRLQKLNQKIIKRDNKWYEQRMEFYRGECRRILGKKDGRLRAKTSKVRKKTKD